MSVKIIIIIIIIIITCGEASGAMGAGFWATPVTGV